MTQIKVGDFVTIKKGVGCGCAICMYAQETLWKLLVLLKAEERCMLNIVTTLPHIK